MAILIKLGLTLVGIAGTVAFSIVAVACLLSGYLTGEKGFAEESLISFSVYANLS